MSVSTTFDFKIPQPRPPARSASAGSQTAQRNILVALSAIQGLSAAFFLGDLWSEVLGLRSTALPYEVQEYIQLLASVGLLAGFLTTSYFLSKSFNSVVSLRRQVDVASGNFQDHLDTLFADWELSPSERAVAVYAMKGFSNAEVAEFRGTSASTVKTQLNAVYRKSGCANRQQLISFLVEELLSGVAID